MKIIEYGHIKPKIIKCNHCGAILEYVPKDFKIFREERFYLTCPVCKMNIHKNNEGQLFTVNDLKQWFER